jgi:hypothetical protein
MITVTGIVEDIHPMDNGAAAGVAVRRPDGRHSFVRVTLGGDNMLIERVGAAWLHGDRVDIKCEPLEPRLGAPIGRVVAVSRAA